MFPVRGCSPAFCWSEEAANSPRSIIGQDHASLNTRNTTAMPDINTNTTAWLSIRTIVPLQSDPSHFTQTQHSASKMLYCSTDSPFYRWASFMDHVNPQILTESRDYNPSYRSRQTCVSCHQGVRIRKKGIGGWVTRSK